MLVRRLWLKDFRNYTAVELDLSDGVTAVVGANGQGKTNLVEAIAWLARGSSFRGAAVESMVRFGVDRAVIRAEVEDAGRTTLLEAELVVGGRNRLQVNHNRVSRQGDFVGHVRATIFGPDDLVLVKGGPAERRRYLDDLLVDVASSNHGLRSDLDRILRQRNSLLRQAGGRNTPEVSTSLDVWDSKLCEVGGDLAARRIDLLEGLAPVAGELVGSLSNGRSELQMAYECAWEGEGLAGSLARARPDDLRRGTSTVGPHRDEVGLSIDGLSARGHASQGEQRSLAVALRLAGHRVVTSHTGSDPVILLDDVFSELDPDRAAALIELLPQTQTVVTTAGDLPAGVTADRRIRAEGGVVMPA
ncbi:MAG: DNA replication/repair protein RecF [Acidimicrobiales bacterium]|jgi:DNA replication and repair protein RecF|nr:DNA replication/repair protein RecF [Acidimicrobiales bacterium]|tara:strand:- start:8880 stop:9959 length:1080 start_codon:yes stop_codon:yes gene_type:complete